MVFKVHSKGVVALYAYFLRVAVLVTRRRPGYQKTGRLLKEGGGRHAGKFCSTCPSRRYIVGYRNWWHVTVELH